MGDGLLAELHLPHGTTTVRTLSALPEFGDELEVDGVVFTVAAIREDEGLPPMVLLAGVIGPPVLVGAGAWALADIAWEPVA